MRSAFLEEFKKTLKKKYLFHLHTNYTDGVNTVHDYCQWAQQNGYEVVIFTEHVRKKLTYSFEDFLTDINEAKQNFPNLKILNGVEVKILPGGDLDLPKSILPNIQILCFACHSFPRDTDIFQKSVKSVIQDTKWKNYIRVWMHPSILSINSGINNDELLRELIYYAIDKEVFIEYNLKYNVPAKNIIMGKKELNIIYGLDAHSIQDVDSLACKVELNVR